MIIQTGLNSIMAKLQTNDQVPTSTDQVERTDHIDFAILTLTVMLRHSCEIRFGPFFLPEPQALLLDSL